MGDTGQAHRDRPHSGPHAGHAGRLPHLGSRLHEQPRRARLWRLTRGLTQAQLASLTGISKSSVERLEKSTDGGVNLRHLVNIALALDCELLDVVDDAWLSYRPLDVAAPAPHRTQLRRSAGGDMPPRQRDRAPRAAYDTVRTT
ncbi:helix-turn-helix domain-containing protein [Conexibacter sp. JD483]|uniref:helix-turn-helix domain-containing protein n=1 Tax=unclassified Conexibacter TaxID=2627773 RepID=UPI002720982F|nr:MULTISPECIES: helix-turn-helix domain-containing protein [unclassified Conexibacter]MDO8188904.1 helix-turn-helix domain-containing protein [Conexibacter sp. CPCC 205706]MDO8200259.1 helix-turn-helix domain-containing protein [Conexibacter sp. CPCC 205762]MDR9371620.1 helix-turn-helix domain-containing protein [Conexibacter sp. JD483]